MFMEQKAQLSDIIITNNLLIEKIYIYIVLLVKEKAKIG